MDLKKHHFVFWIVLIAGVGLCIAGIWLPPLLVPGGVCLAGAFGMWASTYAYLAQHEHEVTENHETEMREQCEKSDQAPKEIVTVQNNMFFTFIKKLSSKSSSDNSRDDDESSNRPSLV